MVKRIFLSVFVFVFILICGLSMSIPYQSLYYYEIDSQNDSVVGSFGETAIIQCNDCFVESDGKVSITGKDPYVVVPCDGVSSFETLSFYFTTFNDSKYTQVKVYFDTGNGFNETETVLSYFSPEEPACIIPSTSNHAKRIRIDVDIPYVFQSLELHSAQAVLQSRELKTSPLISILCIAVAVLVAALFFVFDIKFDFSGKIIYAFKNSSRAILKGCLSFLLCGCIATILELILSRFVFGISTPGFTFNIYRFFLIFGILFAIAYLIICRRIAATKFENVFLGISLIICTTMVLICPFGHASWDIDSHYKWVLNASYIGDAYYTPADTYVTDVKSVYWPASTRAENLEHIEQMNEAYEGVICRIHGKTTIAHRLSGLFMAIARFFGGSFYQVVTFAKMANVLIYCYVCYFAIKKLKSGKMIATVVALIPTSLFLASNFSYDYWVNCFALLGMAYFIGEQQNKDEYISIKDTIIMCAAFALAAMLKLIYAFLLLIPFFMKRKKIQKPKLYYFICTSAIVILGIMFIVKTILQILGGGDMRGGGDVSTVGQIRFFLSEPLHFIKIIIKFVINYISVPSMSGYINNFAYLGMGTGTSAWVVLLLLTALTDKNDLDNGAYTRTSKVLIVLLCFGIAVSIATALYITFTPVGYETVNGCQPRYLIPLLYPVLSIIGWNGLNNSVNRKYYNYSIVLICCAVNFYNIATVMLPSWI